MADLPSVPGAAATPPPGFPPEPLLIDVPAARKALGGIAEGSLRALVKAGELHPIRIGRRVFYNPKQLAIWVEQRTRRSTGND